ncbi:acyl-coenzyme A thioesterase PaaI-like protein [Rhizobium sp. RAS22]|nr:acyl-coenzyme A thioesterase PaaI-like protein [Rhizobium sp. RAS22]
MKNDPWRASRHLIFRHIGSLVALPDKSWVDATTKFVRHHQRVRLAEVQGGLSIGPLEYADFVATRSIVSLAAMTVTISDVQQFAGNAFPCHELGRTRGRLMVSYAECVFMDGDTARSLSEVLISKGVAFAFGDSAGQPVFPVYSQVEDAARATKAEIGASLSYLQPYGERYRANPTRH